MRTLRKNRQAMYYSLQLETKPKYATDDDGNIIYEVVDGEKIPIETGETEEVYSEPIKIFGNITSQLHNAIVRAFGSDDSANYAVLLVDKNKYPSIVSGARIWKKSEVKYKDLYKTIVDESSADYVVRGVLDEVLHNDAYYLQKLNHEVDGNAEDSDS